MTDSESLIKETHELTAQWYKESQEQNKLEYIRNTVILNVFIGILIAFLIGMVFGYYTGYYAGIESVTKKLILMRMGIDFI
jgi:ABC-type phosphate transport system permease subunit